MGQSDSAATHRCMWHRIRTPQAMPIYVHVPTTCIEERRVFTMQMMLRFLKQEDAAVKTLYLAIYGVIVAGAASAVNRHQWVWPNIEQGALLLFCGATCSPFARISMLGWP